jgi:hypothetical protein
MRPHTQHIPSQSPLPSVPMLLPLLLPPLPRALPLFSATLPIIKTPHPHSHPPILSNAHTHVHAHPKKVARTHSFINVRILDHPHHTHNNTFTYLKKNCAYSLVFIFFEKKNGRYSFTFFHSTSMIVLLSVIIPFSFTFATHYCHAMFYIFHYNFWICFAFYLFVRPVVD